MKEERQRLVTCTRFFHNINKTKGIAGEARFGVMSRERGRGTGQRRDERSEGYSQAVTTLQWDVKVGYTSRHRQLPWMGVK